MAPEEKDSAETWERTVWLWMGRFAAAGAFFILLTAFLCRFSETLGDGAGRACLAALAVGAVSGLSAGVLIWKLWHLGNLWQTAAFFIAGIIRSLIALVGVVIIYSFMDISLPWFLGWLAVFYTAFTAMDIWLMMCLMKDYRWTAQDF